MKKLLSLPPNLVASFHEITGLSADEYFCTNDPIGHKLGSGCGTTWLLEQCHNEWAKDMPIDEWIASDRRIILHAGGQSRRLPSYAPSGKILTPIPVFRWERGQKLGQNLLSLQLPLYEQMMEAAPSNIHTMIVSGDVLIRVNSSLLTPHSSLKDGISPDVICYGLWLDSSIAKDHGVFVSDRHSPNVLKQMLQKPSVETLNSLTQTSYYLTDIGVWMLSDKAVKLLMDRSRRNGELVEYDLYSEFGCALGTNPIIDDPELKALNVAIVPLDGGEFYHYGTSHEMISSTLAIQNIVNDQREIMHHGRKPHPSIFVQNAITEIKIAAENTNLWIENSHIGKGWTISHDNIITGVPRNDWNIALKAGQCIDIVPIGEDSFVVRPYMIDDKFAGEMQFAKLFPIVKDINDMGIALAYMLANGKAPDGYELMSADEISTNANLKRLFAQRDDFRKANWSALADNHEHSVFYQLDLDDAAHEFAKNDIPTPKPLFNEEELLTPHSSLLTKISDAMFRSELARFRGEEHESDEKKAFALLREGLTEMVVADKQQPRLAVYSDQIVWGRSPVRIDIAGGWTDTPPYCLMEGGNVINLAIELNGQQPIQTYVRSCKERHIVLRSIDLGAMEVIETYEQLTDFIHVGSPFSIPKAALALAGFAPEFSATRYPSLKAQLDDFGSGIELTLLSAIPAGSGLGTSSILASTVLGALGDFCSLAWDKQEIGRRTLVLEQLLTTGGGWQDQYGGVLGGVKLLQTSRGFDQRPVVRWLPDNIYTLPENAQCHLLYYTGITRTAKTILADIVRRMFLNNNEELRLLRLMKAHTMDMYDAIQRQDFRQAGLLVRKTWQQNQLLDSGTNPSAVKTLTDLVDDLCLGYKLPGAGGGGYLYMIAKDPEAAARIKKTLNANRPNDKARFVEMTLSKSGLQTSRS